MVDEVAVEFADEDRVRQLLFDKISDTLDDGLVIEGALVFLLALFGIQALGGSALLLLLGFLLLDLAHKLEHLALLAVDEQVVAAAVDRLQADLRRHAAEDSVAHNADAVAEHVCLLHRVSSQYDGTLALLRAQDVPQLTSVFRVKACRRFVKVDDLRL